MLPSHYTELRGLTLDACEALDHVSLSRAASRLYAAFCPRDLDDSCNEVLSRIADTRALLSLHMLDRTDRGLIVTGSLNVCASRVRKLQRAVRDELRCRPETDERPQLETL